MRSWNEQDAEKYGGLFADNGSVVGFNGSLINGKREITISIRTIFAHHQTHLYVSKVRDIKPLGNDVILLEQLTKELQELL